MSGPEVDSNTALTQLPLALGGVRRGSNSESESEARATVGPEASAAARALFLAALDALRLWGSDS
eukprot:5825108-Pleurochrysis_carterae.AAC.2